MSLILLGILNSQVDAAGGGGYDLLETQILTTTASSVTFTGLGSYSNYKHLQIRGVGSNTGLGTGLQRAQITLNGDTGTNYSYHFVTGNGSSTESFGESSVTSMKIFDVFPDQGATNVFGGFVTDFLDFSSTTKNTTIRSLSGAVSGGKRVGLFSGAYYNTAAITSITVTCESASLIAGSRFSLYGVKA